MGCEADDRIHEVHHRVKNSLQLVASMLASHARQSSDRSLGGELTEAARRIVAVARLHEHLQQDHDGPVEVADYLAVICRDLTASTSDGANDRRVRLWAIKAELPAAEALALGLIVNELVINALKHAYPEGGGLIDVNFEHSPGGYRLIVADHGVGFSDARVEKFDGVGSTFVRQFAARLRGLITTTDNAPGVRVSLTFGQRTTAIDPTRTVADSPATP
jgi:two-component sensor histidine kinase